MNQSRRAFLRRAGIAVSSAAVASTIDNLTLTSALAQGPGYKALVCVFLNGGNDSNNMVIPTGTLPEEYPLYTTARAGAQLAFSQAQLAATNLGNVPNCGYRPFAFHPSFNVAFQNNPSILQLWNAGRAAVVANVGPLIAPLHTIPGQTPRQAYAGNPSLRPYQLFSHSDQQSEHQTAYPYAANHSGWGGRIADRQPLHSSGFPIATTIAGNTAFSLGISSRPLALSPAPAALNGVLQLAGYGNIAQEPERSRREAFDFLRTTGRSSATVRAAGDVMQQAVDVAAALSVNPVINTQFPNTGLGNQLLQVARVIRANRDQVALRLPRQIFFTQIGGFDTHQNQTAAAPPYGGQGNLLQQLSQAIGSFYNAMVELGLQNDVTLFTLSDFNRTFDPAGNGVGVVGSDHAWGAHQLVFGGGVNGTASRASDFYGVVNPFNYTPFPVLLQGRNVGNSAVMDTDSRGRWVPTTAVDQYAATLARWFGVSEQDLQNYVFPYLNRFDPPDLGFMS